MSARRRITSLAVAAVVALGLTLLVAQPATALNTGIVQGTLTRAGAAISTGEQVALRGYVGSETIPSTVRYSAVDASGNYQFTEVEPGKYTIEFEDQTPGSHYSGQFYPHADYFEQASTFMVANGDTKTADAQLKLGASVAVHVVQATNKIPSVNASVTFLSETSPGSYFTLFTDSGGMVSWPKLTPGDWAVQISQSGFNLEYFNNWQSEALSEPDWLTSTGGADLGTLDVWVRSSVQPSTTFFQDVPGTSSFSTAIQFMVDQKLSTGTPVAYERPLYKPLDPVSRQAMAQFLFRLGAPSYTAPATPDFADVPTTSPFYTAIEWMFASGISTGTPQGGGLKPLYKPADPVSRSSMATFLYRMADPSFTPPDVPSFADVPTTASNYTAIEWMFAAGISTGTSQGAGQKPLYKPADAVSRQAMAQFLYRFH